LKGHAFRHAVTVGDKRGFSRCGSGTSAPQGVYWEILTARLNSLLKIRKGSFLAS